MFIKYDTIQECDGASDDELDARALLASPEK